MPSQKKNPAKQTSRLWLTFPPKLIKRPLIYEVGKKFAVVTNIRQASVTEQLGVVSLELSGAPAEIKRAIAWLEQEGVKVEPIEINTIES
jgi:ABC-type methionine transport system ATPase subunit